MNKNKIYFTIGIIAVVLIAAIATFSGINNQEEPNEDVIRIGGAFALSGFAAVWGEAEMNGALLAVEEFNSNSQFKKAELISEDTGSDQIKTLNSVMKLIEIDGVHVIIGPTWAGVYSSALPIIEKEGILMVSPSDSLSVIEFEKDYDNILSTWPDPVDEAKEIVSDLVETNRSEVYLIFENNAYWKVFSDSIKEQASDNNLTILGESLLNFQEKDYRTPLLKAKQTNSKTIIFGINEEISLISFLKQRKEIFSSSTLYTVSYITDFEDNPDYDGLLQGIKYVYAPQADNGFTEKYNDRFGINPVFSASYAYDGTKILLEAIEATSSTSVEDIVNYVQQKEFDTVSYGKSTFDERGALKSNNLVIETIKQ